ncbi:MAG TPA: DUF4037 domain-containing protein [Chloroflexia bacterium]|nr:DUF4037 domain-containing protein [Chloroflexia bacterium]
MLDFIPGIELSRRFYEDAVRPVLNRYFPGLPHAGAHLGPGSDVLGFDTPMSTDHGWGPTVRLFLREEDAGLGEQITGVMREQLPPVFLGYSVHMAESPAEPGTPVMAPAPAGALNHRVYPTTVRAFVHEQLGSDVANSLTAADWLAVPSQQLRSLTGGAVHHDGVGELTAARAHFAWYPHDVWLYLLAAEWQRIGQEEHLMPRAGYTGDELGSALIGARLVRSLMSLAFLMESQYAPYPKWFGTAFSRLACAADLGPFLWRAQQAPTWPEREESLVAAYEYMARRHNDLDITAPLPATAGSFFGRPFRVIHGSAFADAIRAQIADPAVQRIAARPLIGNIDQFSDNTDLRSNPVWHPVVRRLYTG